MSHSAIISQAIDVIARTYHKILRVNLTDDTYETIKVRSDEMEQVSEVKCFSKWITNFADRGCVYEGDVNIYRTKLQLDSLRRHFNENDRFRLRYRRKTDGVYRWVFMEILPDKDFTKECQKVWLYVQDIHDSYVHEMEVQRELEHFCKFDTLTGLNNYYSYQTLCRSFAANDNKSSVAVIFADLNGLKLVNDTRGHAAGNEFLRSFTRKLVDNFQKDSIYRISGDEFLIVFQNTSRETVGFMSDNFAAILNQEAVPQASIGYAWSEHPMHIEDVARDAETHMYDSKEKFYEQHPEYKRGIAELNYKREIDAILQTLSNSYAVMSTIDLLHNSYRVLKSIAGTGHYPTAENYSTMIEEMIPMVDPDYQELVINFFSIEHLSREFLKNQTLVCEYKNLRGRWHQATFKIIETLDGKPSKALFILESVDRNRADKLEQHQDLLIEHQIIEGLSKNYSMICRIEISTHKLLLYKNLSLLDSITTAMKMLDYGAVVKWFVQKYVVAEDKARVNAFLEFDNIKKKLQEKNECSILFRTTPEFHNTKDVSYSQFYFYRLKSDPDKIVLATKNVTKSMG